jgi:ATP-dependent DNA helicase RecG
VKKNAPSTIQVLIKKASHVPYAQEIIEYYQTERTREEIQKYIKINNRKYFRESILNPLLELSVIRMTIPDKPNSSKQKYITVEEEAKNE